MLASPRVSQAQAEEIAREYYGVSGTAERLAAEHDDAFRLVLADGTSRLIKVGAVDPVAAADQLPDRGAAAPRTEPRPELPVQRVVPALDGRPS